MSVKREREWLAVVGKRGKVEALREREDEREGKMMTEDGR